MASPSKKSLTWLAFFEHFQHLRERYRFAMDKLGRLRAVLTRPTRWRRTPLLAAHLDRELEFLNARLGLCEVKILDVLRESTSLELTAESGLAAIGARIDVELELCERRVDLFDEFLAQRQMAFDAANWDVAFGRHGDHEDCELVFRAADSTVLGYFIDIFGEDWVSQKILKRGIGDHWFPIAVFGGGTPYEISPEHLVASVPEVDLYRTRLWPSLAHEIGHLKVMALFRVDPQRPGLLIFPRASDADGKSEEIDDETTWSDDRRQGLERIFPDPADRSLNALRSLQNNYLSWLSELGAVYRQLLAEISTAGTSPSPGVFPEEDLQAAVFDHAEEIVADAIAIAAAGPAALWSFMALGAWDTTFGESAAPQEAAHNAICQSHPTSILRLELMRLLLVRWKAFIPDDGLEQVAIEYRDQLLTDMQLPAQRVAKELLADTPRMLDLVVPLAEQLVACAPFGTSGSSEVDICQNLFRFPHLDGEADLSEWAPRLTLNFAWMKRCATHRHLIAEDQGDVLRREAIMDCGGSPAAGLLPELARRLSMWGEFRLKQLASIQIGAKGA